MRVLLYWKQSTIEEKILWLYIMLIPFSEAVSFYFGVKRFGITDFVFVALLIAFIIKCLKGATRFHRTAMEPKLLLMLVLFSFSLLNSTNVVDSLSELSGLLYLIALFMIIPSIISTPEGLLNSLKVFLYSAAAISLLGLFYLFKAFTTGNISNTPFLNYSTIESMAHHFPRIRFMFESPNMLLAYLHAALIAGLIIFLSEKKKKAKIYAFFACCAILTAAFLTGSRRFSGLLLSVFLVLAWFGKSKISSFLKYAAFLSAVFFIAASIVTSVWVIFPVEMIKDKINKRIILKADYSYSLHFIQPVASVNMFKKHPFIGVGMGSYNANFKSNVDWKWLRSSFGFDAYPEYIAPVEKETLRFDPHSVFLGTLAETGICGFFGLVNFFMGYALFLILRFKRAVKTKNLYNPVLGCILAGFVGFLLNGLTLDILSMRYFWLMLSFGVAASLQQENT